MKVLKLPIIIALLISIVPVCLMAQGLTLEEQVHDFGHVGIDFKIKHTYIFENRTDVPIKINDIVVTCDCTEVNSADTLVLPGDTAFFHLTFNTKDYYGPINKSFTVMTDHPTMPELDYYYLAIVGQWFNGLKPNPISIFFLPSKKNKTVLIPNRTYDEISIVSVSYTDNFITTNITQPKAEKGKYVEVDVFPADNLGAGTFHTTVHIGLQTDDEELTWFSIPVKIVKY